MAVNGGRNGSITVFSSSQNKQTIAEMGSWTISGPTLNMVDHTAFGQEDVRSKRGIMGAQTITFSGYHDRTDSTGQHRLLTWLSSGREIECSSSHGLGKNPYEMRIWANTDSDLDGYGFWMQSTLGGAEANIYITGVDVAQSKDGLETIAFTAAVTGGDLIWRTST